MGPTGCLSRARDQWQTVCHHRHDRRDSEAGECTGIICRVLIRRREKEDRMEPNDGGKEIMEARSGKEKEEPGLKKHEPLFKPLDRKQFRFSVGYFLVMLLMLFLINSLFLRPKVESIDYSAFKAKIESGEIHRVEMGDKYLTGVRLDQGPDGGIRQGAAQREEEAHGGSEDLSNRPDRRSGPHPAHGHEGRRILRRRPGEQVLAGHPPVLGAPDHPPRARLELSQQTDGQDPARE